MQRGGTTRNDIWMLPLADGRAAGNPHVVVDPPYERRLFRGRAS